MYTATPKPPITSRGFTIQLQPIDCHGTIWVASAIVHAHNRWDVLTASGYNQERVINLIKNQIDIFLGIEN